MTRNEALATSNYYTLSKPAGQEQKATLATALKRFVPVMADEGRSLVLAFTAIIITSGTSLLGPVIIGRAVDIYIRNRNFNGVLVSAGLLLGVYLCGLFAS